MIRGATRPAAAHSSLLQPVLPSGKYIYFRGLLLFHKCFLLCRRSVNAPNRSACLSLLVHFNLWQPDAVSTHQTAAPVSLCWSISTDGYQRQRTKPQRLSLSAGPFQLVATRRSVNAPNRSACLSLLVHSSVNAPNRSACLSLLVHFNLWQPDAVSTHQTAAPVSLLVHFNLWQPAATYGHVNRTNMQFQSITFQASERCISKCERG